MSSGTTKRSRSERDTVTTEPKKPKTTTIGASCIHQAHNIACKAQRSKVVMIANEIVLMIDEETKDEAKTEMKPPPALVVAPAPAPADKVKQEVPATDESKPRGGATVQHWVHCGTCNHARCSLLPLYAHVTVC
jgi:hypothetical protein